MITVLFLGDVFGKPGRGVLREHLPELIAKHQPQLVLANGENASGGLGIDSSSAEELYRAGVQIITSGNHIWQRKGIDDYLNKNTHRMLRPINFPEGSSGSGCCTIEVAGAKVFIVNAIGRVFMPQLVDCPFRALDSAVKKKPADASITIVDFHAEASSEKVSMGYFLDGRVSLVVGTHTHVQTADDRVLSEGTAFISDMGMCGPRESVIGVKKELILERFLSGRITKFDVAKGQRMINGVLAEIDENTGKALRIERIFEVYG